LAQSEPKLTKSVDPSEPPRTMPHCTTTVVACCILMSVNLQHVPEQCTAAEPVGRTSERLSEPEETIERATERAFGATDRGPQRAEGQNERHTERATGTNARADQRAE
jgi:hypothetical protein